MEYREFTCAFCGKKAIDMSPSKTKKFCSQKCAEKSRLKTRVTDICIHNNGILCPERKCGGCGWNPNVEMRRKEAMGYG